MLTRLIHSEVSFSPSHYWARKNVKPIIYTSPSDMPTQATIVRLHHQQSRISNPTQFCSDSKLLLATAQFSSNQRTASNAKIPTTYNQPVSIPASRASMQDRGGTHRNSPGSHTDVSQAETPASTSPFLAPFPNQQPSQALPARFLQPRCLPNHP